MTVIGLAEAKSLRLMREPVTTISSISSRSSSTASSASAAGDQASSEKTSRNGNGSRFPAAVIQDGMYLYPMVLSSP